MKILVTNGSLVHFTGTETWTLTMVTELQRQGHEVTVFTNHIGAIADLIPTKVITKYEGEYDFAIVNHRTTYDKLPYDLPKIFTSHSSVFDIEKPPEGADTVYINERIGTPVIRNGVDLERFKYAPTKEIPTILYLSNPMYSGGRELVAEACEGYEVIYLTGQVFEIEELIHKADIVISYSRGAIEAMACGRHVVYGDFRRDWSRSFQMSGMVTEDNINDFVTGECFNQLKQATAAELRKEIEKYDYTKSKFYREQAEKHFDIKNTAKQYVDRYLSTKVS